MSMFGRKERYFCVIFILTSASKVLVRPEYIFLSPDRLPGRNDVASDNVNFRPDSRKNYFSKKK